MTDNQAEKRISAIIGNSHLAASLCASISSAIKASYIKMAGGNSVWDIFKRSLDTAIRDIEEHPRGHLFKRLLEFGPHEPDAPEAKESDGQGLLSDIECGFAVNFIFSHMVNRFKGELAEILSIEPCATLIQKLQKEGRLPTNAMLYWGDMIQERRRLVSKESGKEAWGSFTKGADGLLVEEVGTGDAVVVKGIVEVKSMRKSLSGIIGQIESHSARLKGGIKLGTGEYAGKQIRYNKAEMLRCIVIPSDQKLSRAWHTVKTERGHAIVPIGPDTPQLQTQIEEITRNHWKITLAWSQEAIEQAAYEMTFWYMAQVGKSIYSAKPLPIGWEYMTPEEAGYNAIKEKLYYIPLRNISARQEQRAIKLYNIYCFSYPLGVDSKEMLWPQDFPNTIEQDEASVAMSQAIKQRN